MRCVAAARMRIVVDYCAKQLLLWQFATSLGDVVTILVQQINWLQGYTRRALRSEIRKPRRSKRMRGIGNSFQPAIVASRFDLMNCDIAPSAKMSILESDCAHIAGTPDQMPVKYGSQ